MAEAKKPRDEQFLFSMNGRFDLGVNMGYLLREDGPELLKAAQQALEQAETARKTFVDGNFGSDLPSIDVPKGELEEGIPAFVLMARAGLNQSNGEARRLIRGGGARINDEKIDDEGRTVSLADTNDQGVIKLSAGKKRHALVRPS